MKTISNISKTRQKSPSENEKMKKDENGHKYPDDSPKMPDFLGRQMAANVPMTRPKFPYYSVGKWLQISRKLAKNAHRKMKK